MFGHEVGGGGGVRRNLFWFPSSLKGTFVCCSHFQIMKLSKLHRFQEIYGKSLAELTPLMWSAATLQLNGPARIEHKANRDIMMFEHNRVCWRLIAGRC